MSIQSNFGTSRPSLLLDFANTKQLDPRITFTRASTANYYDGKSAAMAEQNLLTYSEQFDNGVWGKAQCSVTANATTAPDGTTTADKLAENTTSVIAHQLYNSVTLSETLSFSVYLKAAERTFATIGFGGSADYVSFNLSTGVVGTLEGNATGTITYVGNGWYRCVAKRTTSSGGVGSNVSIWPALSAGGTSSGISYAGTVGYGIYLWGAQLEQRSTVSAYTATTSVPITNYIPTLQSAASGVARFDSNPTTGESLGLLIEESRTNSLTASGQLGTIAWSNFNGSVAANALVAPDGTATGCLWTVSGTAGSAVYKSGLTFTSGTTYTTSCYFKAGTTSYGYISAQGSGVYASTVFNLAAGSVGSSVTNGSGVVVTNSIQSVGNGWYRCSITYVANSSMTICAFGASSVGTFVSFDTSGNPQNNVNGSNLYVWGAQTETGSSATSYVATPLTFTSRASSATYLGPNGYITSATTNTARNQTNSVGTTNLLLESAASNLLKYTDYIGNWSTSDCSVAVNQTQSPEGLMFGSKMVENTVANTLHYVTSATFSETSGTTYTASIYAKAGGRNIIQFNAGTITGAGVFFDLSSGTVTSGSGGTITALGNGWYRCSATGVSTTTQSTSVVRIYTLVSGTYPFYTGDGVSGVYLWGAQFEAGSTATSYIPSVETFSGRSSSGTYYNSSGVLATATSGTSRTTYNPALLGAGGKLLLEPAATNLALYSEQFDNANWAKASLTVTANAVTAPDGNTTADKIISNNGVAGQIYQTYSKSASAITYTATVYAKAAEFSWLQIAFYDGSANGCRGWFDLSAGATGTTAGIGTPYTGVTLSIQAINNGWYRCSLTATTNTAGSNVLYLYPVNGDGASTVGNGTNGIYLWGAQYETSAGATSYITTTSSAVTRAADTSTSAAQSRSADVYSASTVTRAADSATMTGTNLTSWWRTDSGTFYSETIKPASNTLAAFWSFDAITVDMVSSATNINFRYGNNVNPDLPVNGTFTTARVAGSYQPNANHSLSINGATTVVSSVVSAIPAVTTFKIGYSSNGGTFFLNGPVKKIAFYPLTLTDAQLQALTS